MKLKNIYCRSDCKVKLRATMKQLEDAEKQQPVTPANIGKRVSMPSRVLCDSNGNEEPESKSVSRPNTFKLFVKNSLYYATLWCNFIVPHYDDML